MLGGSVAYDTVLPLTDDEVDPLGTAGVTGPKPVPHSTTVSPAAAGAEPGNVPAGATSVPSACVAIAYLPDVKNAGAKLSATAVTELPVPLEFVTVTAMDPVPVSGACTLICVGLM